MDIDSRGAVFHSLFREVYALHSVLAELKDKVHEETGLSTSKRKILREILQRSKTVPEIADNIKTSRQFVQEVCNDMKCNNLIEFIENPRHKRSKKVKITSLGRKELETAAAREHAFIDAALSGVSEDGVLSAIEVLADVRKKLI